MRNLLERLAVPGTDDGNSTSTDGHLDEYIAAPGAQSMPTARPGVQTLARLVGPEQIDQVHGLGIPGAKRTCTRARCNGAHDEGALDQRWYEQRVQHGVWLCSLFLGDARDLTGVPDCCSRGRGVHPAGEVQVAAHGGWGSSRLP